jgi:hypothetical protein
MHNTTKQVLLPPYLPSSTQLSQCTTTNTNTATNNTNTSSSVNEGIAVPPAVRALAFVTLGKLCLRDAALAKRSVTVLVSNCTYLNLLNVLFSLKCCCTHLMLPLFVHVSCSACKAFCRSIVCYYALNDTDYSTSICYVLYTVGAMLLHRVCMIIGA